jgi:hypothetical protein
MSQERPPEAQTPRTKWMRWGSRGLFLLGAVLPWCHFVSRGRAEQSPGIAFWALGFLGLAWGNPAWFSLVPLFVASRRRRADQAAPVLDQYAVSIGLAAFIFLAPLTMTRPIWGTTTRERGWSSSEVFTQLFIDVRGLVLEPGALLLFLSVCAFVASRYDHARERSVARTSIVRASILYASIVAASLLFRAAVLSEAFRFTEASMPGAAFLFEGFLGPFVGHFGWFANASCAVAWYGTLSSAPLVVRRAGWTTIVLWGSCVSILLVGVPANAGIVNQGAMPRVGFLYWTLFLMVPFVANEIASRIARRAAIASD